MPKDKTRDPAFEVAFFESVLRRDSSYADVVEILGGLYTKMGRIGDGLKMDRRLVRLQPSNATAHYNLACSLALSRRKADALRSLRQAVALGYRDFDWMSQDPDPRKPQASSRVLGPPAAGQTAELRIINSAPIESARSRPRSVRRTAAASRTSNPSAVNRSRRSSISAHGASGQRRRQPARSTPARSRSPKMRASPRPRALPSGGPGPPSGAGRPRPAFSTPPNRRYWRPASRPAAKPRRAPGRPTPAFARCSDCAGRHVRAAQNWRFHIERSRRPPTAPRWRGKDGLRAPDRKLFTRPCASLIHRAVSSSNVRQ